MRARLRKTTNLLSRRYGNCFSPETKRSLAIEWRHCSGPLRAAIWSHAADGGCRMSFVNR